MNKQILFESALRLKQPESEAVQEYENKRGTLVAKVDKLMLNRSDINGLVCKKNIEMMMDNHANHARFMISIFHVFNAEVLIETILWVFRAYRNRGFTTNYWAAQLNTWINVLGEELSEASYKEIYPYYQWMLVNIPVFTELSQQNIDSPFSDY